MIVQYISTKPFIGNSEITLCNKEVTTLIQTTSQDDLVRLLEKQPKILSLDTETTGLHPIKAKPILLQIGNLEEVYVIDLRTMPLRGDVLKLLNNTTTTFIGSNIGYDYNILKQLDVLLPNVEDILVNESLISAGTVTEDVIKQFRANTGFYYYSLAGLTVKYAGVSLIKSLRNIFPILGNSPLKTNDIVYAIDDIISSYIVYQEQQPLLKEYNYHIPRQIGKYFITLPQFEGKVTLALADIEYNGMFIDPSGWKEVAIEFNRQLVEVTEELNEIALATNFVKDRQLSIFDNTYTGINWGSTPQKLKFLAHLEVYPKDKKGKITTEAKTLMHYVGEHKAVSLLLKRNKIAKMATTYGEKFITDHYDKDDSRIRTSFWQIVATGRMSSREPNLQNIPNTAKTRACFQAPKGSKLIIADYSQQEPRITADKSQDPILLDFFINGDGDSHSLVARQIVNAITGESLNITSENVGFSTKFNKTWRAIGKTINLGLDYGKSAQSLQYDLSISKEDAELLYNAAVNAFPGKKAYFERIIEKSLRDGFIETNPITGRRRYFEEFDRYLDYLYMYNRTRAQWKAMQKLQGEYSRVIMNTPTQGTAGDMTKLALVYCREDLLSLNIRPVQSALIKITGVVHDEIISEATDELTEFWAPRLGNHMIAAGDVFCKSVKMVAKPSISNHWTH